jgi:hypothetical protein
MYPTSLFLMAAMAPALVAQAPSDWFQLLHQPKNQVLVQARVVNSEGKRYLQFRNEGQEQVNFYFSVNGEDPYTSPRVHLNAQKRSPFLLLPESVSGRTVKLALVRVGEDQSDEAPE